MTRADARPTAQPQPGRLAGGGAHKQTLADSLTTFVGRDTYRTDELYADLHRFVFLLGRLNDSEQLFRSPHHDRKPGSHQPRLTGSPV
jgi:hypothetical protein